jgi:membrane-bound ClpP family serine protease
VEKWLIDASSRNFVFYTILALFLAFFLVVFLKKRSKINNREIAILLLSMGLVFFLLFSRPVFLFQLIVLEMFILGLFIALEGKKSKSLLPFVLILVTAALVEISSNLSIGSSFYYFDAWRNTLIALSGYLTGCLLC